MGTSYEGTATGEAPEVAPTVDNKVAPILYAMVDCLETELEASIGGEPCFVGVMPGDLVPMDFCDCATGNNCGTGYVRLASVYPSRVFPTQDTDARCGSPLAAVIAVGVFRCLPGLDDRGNPPGVLAQAQAVQVQMADMMAARRAIACCPDPSTKYVLGAYTPIGPAGNCGGGQWTVSVQVM